MVPSLDQVRTEHFTCCDPSLSMFIKSLGGGGGGGVHFNDADANLLQRCRYKNFTP